MKYLNRSINIEVIGEYDVIVCGGGPAGFCAAVQSGRMGCSTCLIERYGMPGGAMTVGGISNPMSFHAFGEQVIGGIGWELMECLLSRGWALIPDSKTLAKQSISCVSINPIVAIYYMEHMLLNAGVDIYYHQNICDVILHEDEGGKKISFVVVSTKSGLKAIKGLFFIDCTGDGDIAAWSGADFEFGDPVTGEIQPGSFSFFIDGYEPDKINREDTLKLYEKAISKGMLKPDDYWGNELFGIDELLRRKGININHIAVNGADSISRTQAEIQGHASAVRVAEWMRKVTGDRNLIKPIICSPEVWPRESRRILGDSYIIWEDYMCAKKYDDAVCYCFYPIDIHLGNGKKNSPKVILNSEFLKKGSIPTIPMGSMRVRGFKNLLTAGRCISGDHLANAAYRVQATCMAMGQSAGMAVALAVKSGKNDTRSVPMEEIRRELRRNGAIVP